MRDYFPFQSHAFESILMVSTFKHIFKPHLAAHECNRVLTPAGSLVIIEPLSWLVNVGGWLGYFDLRNISNPWDTRQTAREFSAWGFRTLKAGSYFCFQFIVLQKSADVRL